ncbi:DNA-3-methyladenine glycosylase [Oceanirhabdus sp. W0125-5]|uniref:DNA-3-methyladenine glycosylase n=1 Tax=Oceanirhabdus sp. W0125-5 TaxID=2999116 RepID=UPI0022F2EE87|nr:DNA-3-methyladenine glycosylase [Oceanirhabdus sp. W0125-5]WBW97876.1 DNA-3-methyladenine glycosylase [Oceanirhabdus sp. W0125-5]
MEKIELDFNKKLNREFYTRDGITLAKELLGKILVRRIEDEFIACKIVETEAYMGPEDKGCHAYGNRKTKRTKTMFFEGGHSYVYLIYGMYNCLNVVANSEGKPEAVLIRAVEPLHGIEYIREFRKIKSNKTQNYTNGPGKLCMALNLDKSHDGLDLVHSNEIFILDNEQQVDIVESKRINIDYAEEFKDKLWRFYIKDNTFVSKK